MNETQRSLFMAALVVLLERNGGELRISEAEYERTKRTSVTTHFNGKEITLKTVVQQ